MTTAISAECDVTGLLRDKAGSSLNDFGSLLLQASCQGMLALSGSLLCCSEVVRIIARASSGG